MANDLISENIFISRDQIRDQFITYAKEYLELDGVDLAKSSFLSYIINILSTMTGNLIFYQSSTFKEFFLTKSQLPEAIYNLSAGIGYSPKYATAANVDSLITLPLSFTDNNVTFEISKNSIFKTSDNINFVSKYKIIVNILNNSSVTVKIEDEDKTYDSIPYIDTSVTPSNLSFIVPLTQNNINEQEFQIDSDIPTFQFITIDVPTENQVSTIKVEVKNPGSSSWDIYTSFSSLYLMKNTDKGFVFRKSPDGIRLYFGNGLFGTQPVPGGTVLVTIYETSGINGNVISATIKNGPKLYHQDNLGKIKNINYSVTNVSPAINGSDEESLEEIRSNSIANLVSMSRLVSEPDYKNLNTIAPKAPISNNSLAILKRSDVVSNEIILFSQILFASNIVPTKNIKYQVSLSTTEIERGTIIQIDSIDYITPYKITIDPYNETSYYEYTLYEIEQVPSLIKTYGQEYNLIINNLIVKKTGNVVNFDLNYQSTELDANLLTCKLLIVKNGVTYNMLNTYIPPNLIKFNISISPYTIIPEGQQTIYFTIQHPTLGLISQYSSTFAIRHDLSDFTASNTFTDSTSIIIYDIPVIQKSYYDSIDQKSFETQVLQNMLSTLDFSKYRMLTDFVNFKFTNTTGLMKNMTMNKTTILDVIDFNPNRNSIPISPTIGDRYIVSGLEGGSWDNQKNKIATFLDSTSSIQWSFTQPSSDDIVKETTNNKKYIYTASGWIIPEYTIPLIIELEVFKESTYFGSDSKLINLVKESLLSEFSSRFGSNISLFRSEIVKNVQIIDGVNHCRVIKPESNIFFNYDINELTNDQLLEYTPEYVYFTADEISVKVI